MSMVEGTNTRDILVAIDGSLPSKNAAKAAILYAKKQRLKICGLYVVGSRMVMQDGIAVKTELPNQTESNQTSTLLDQFKSQGDEVLNWLEQQCYASGVLVTTEICFGGIPEMILEGARDALFLSLGRRGYAHQNEAAYLGDNFDNILSHQNAPFLIGGEEVTNFKRLWVIISSEDEIIELVNWGQNIQKAFSCDVFVSTYQGNEVLNNLASAALVQIKETNPVGYKQMLDPVQSGEEIAENSKNNQIDLIIMGRYRRNALGFLMDKSPLEDALLYSPTTVFVI